MSFINEEKMFIVPDSVRELLKEELLYHTGGGGEHWDRVKKDFVELSKVTRVEVINETGKVESHGRVFTEHNVKLEFNIQDEGRTLKIFVREPEKKLEFKELPKEHIKLLLKALDMYGTKCNNCEVIITEKTYGFIHADVVVCNSVLCQLWAFEKIRVLG